MVKDPHATDGPPPRDRFRLMEPQKIYDGLDRFVIGQEHAKRTVAVAAYNHLKRLLADDPLIKKSNILMIGPTGSGKTHIARTLAQVLEVPFVVVNATEYTEAGYYGKDVEVMIAELLYATDGDLAAAERGIVFVDEIDKVARRSHGARTGAGARDIGGEGVQQAMLKLLESNKLFVPLNVTQHWNKHDFVQVDVTNILFICAGTFSDLGAGRYKGDIGFSGRTAQDKSAKQRVATRELEEYGMIAELLGRLPILTQLAELTDPQMARILVEPPDAVMREYQRLFAFENIQLDLTEDGIRAVVAQTRLRKLGARGLRGIVDEVLADLSFHAPANKGRTVRIDAAYVEDHLSHDLAP